MPPSPPPTPRPIPPNASGPKHQFEQTVAPADIDLLGHASNIAVVRWIQEAAVGHSDAVGWTYPRYLDVGGVFVVRRHEIDYLGASFAGDNVRVTTWVTRFSAATSTRETEIHRDGKLIIKSQTTWAFIDKETARPRKIPQDLAAAFMAPPPATSP